MHRIVMLASSSLLCLPALAQPAQAEIVVNISKSQQQLAVMIDGAELYRWPVSTGRRGLETPSGAFRPIRLERKWYSRKYDWSPMPYSIFFHRGYAVHGTLERRSLGRPRSHGCVRLLPANASTLFSLVREQGKGNTRIVVMNGPLPLSPGAVPMTEMPKARPAALPAPKHEKVAEVVARKAEPEIAVPLPAVFKPQFAEQPKPQEKPAARLEEQPKAAIPPSVPAKKMTAIPVPQPRHVRPQAVAPRIVRVRVDDNFVAAGDEAAVLRGRAAWLRSLDRKYGIVR